MDRDDPEQRIADLERQLAEQKRMAELQRQRAEPVGQPPQMPDASAGAQGEPIRCVLSSYGAFKTYFLAIDIGQDAVWVRRSAGAWRITSFPSFDPEKSALVTSVRRAEVTATPARWNCGRQPVWGGTNWMAALIVRVAGLPSLTIGGREYIDPHWNSSASSLRFRWRGEVPEVGTPAYWASGGDWLPLVENFGLAPYLEDKASAQPGRDAREWIASQQDAKGRDRRR